MICESLVKSCLYNWLGYGNINSPIWFIGTEEGGAEIWREKTQTLESSLQLRCKYEISMNFYHVWEELYGINLNNFKGITVWHFIACFMISLEDKARTSERIRNFIFNDKRLGRIESDHFLCELLPLPKRSKGSIHDYAHIWSNVGKYQLEVLSNRFNLITNNLVKNKKVKLLISYESTLTSTMLKNFHDYQQIDSWLFGKQKYSLYKIRLNERRDFYLLSTPFFGQGQISYEGLGYAANKVKHIISL